LIGKADIRKADIPKQTAGFPAAEPPAAPPKIARFAPFVPRRNPNASAAPYLVIVRRDGNCLLVPPDDLS
jgi:hypothetical protein